VVCIDRNSTQLALLDLKMTAIRRLDPPEARLLLGLTPARARERQELFQSLQSHLPPVARSFWNAHIDAIHDGVLNLGKFERYLALFRRFVLPLVQWPGTVRRMCELSDLDEQRELYRTRWDSWRWRTLFRLFFSRKMMEKRGRQKEFFDHVEETNIADVFMKRAERALTEMPVATNPYLRWILDEANLVPPYLSDEWMPVVRERLDRIVVLDSDLAAPLDSARPGTYSAYNLSDCLEYMDEAAANALLTRAVSAAQEGARLVYWNLLVPRDGSQVPGLEAVGSADDLYAVDRAFFYGRLVVEQVASN
jgi:S-adenosylmethionine-diacylglycerol 3-amino-3-carboxypropyl transferase